MCYDLVNTSFKNQSEMGCKNYELKFTTIDYAPVIVGKILFN